MHIIAADSGGVQFLQRSCGDYGSARAGAGNWRGVSRIGADVLDGWRFAHHDLQSFEFVRSAVGMRQDREAAHDRAKNAFLGLSISDRYGGGISGRVGRIPSSLQYERDRIERGRLSEIVRGNFTGLDRDQAGYAVGQGKRDLALRRSASGRLGRIVGAAQRTRPGTTSRWRDRHGVEPPVLRSMYERGAL